MVSRTPRSHAPRPRSRRTPRRANGCSRESRSDGPLSSLDFERERGSDDRLVRSSDQHRPRACSRRTPSQASWGSRDATASACTTTSSSGCCRRSCFGKTVPLREQMRHKLLSRYRAHGLLGVGGGGDIFGGIGPAKPDPRYPGNPGRTALREELVESGDVVPVPGRGRERQALRAPRRGRGTPGKRPRNRPRPSRSSRRSTRWSGIARLLGSLFEFDYVWELFHPPAKRRWGWAASPRSSSATASSAGSSRGSTALAAVSR